MELLRFGKVSAGAGCVSGRIDAAAAAIPDVIDAAAAASPGKATPPNGVVVVDFSAGCGVVVLDGCVLFRLRFCAAPVRPFIAGPCDPGISDCS